jgi:hypothetical protein
MNKRVLLAGVLGAVAMFLWTFIAHELLPLGEAGIQQISNEQALLSQMSSTINAHGMYIFPNMPPGGNQADYEQKITSGPSGMLIYFPKRDFSFGKALAIEFGTEFVQALIAAYLLSLTAISGLGGRLGFYAVVGLLAAFATNVSYWNWYGFANTYTASYMFTAWVAYLCAGLAASIVMRKSA